MLGTAGSSPGLAQLLIEAVTKLNSSWFLSAAAAATLMKNLSASDYYENDSDN